jgi:cyanophycinase-like exopeptidase
MGVNHSPGERAQLYRMGWSKGAGALAQPDRLKDDSDFQDGYRDGYAALGEATKKARKRLGAPKPSILRTMEKLKCDDHDGLRIITKAKWDSYSKNDEKRYCDMLDTEAIDAIVSEAERGETEITTTSGWAMLHRLCTLRKTIGALVEIITDSDHIATCESIARAHGYSLDSETADKYEKIISAAKKEAELQILSRDSPQKSKH